MSHERRTRELVPGSAPGCEPWAGAELLKRIQGWAGLLDADWRADLYDVVIDVRRPAEFHADRIAGALNGYGLDDSQSTGNAVEEAELVERNVQNHLATMALALPINGRALVYGSQEDGWCEVWRRRLESLGIRCDVLPGGFAGFRGWIQAQVEGIGLGCMFNVIMGPAGTGKTALLRELGRRGSQVIDLEREVYQWGGEKAGGSSHQVVVSLSKAIGRMDKDQPIWIERPFSDFAGRWLPRDLVSNIRSGMVVYLLSAPVASRARNWSHAHKDRDGGGESLVAQMVAACPELSAASCQQGRSGLGGTDLAEMLMTLHYNPEYAKEVERAMADVHQVVNIGMARADLRGVQSVAARLA